MDKKESGEEAVEKPVEDSSFHNDFLVFLREGALIGINSLCQLAKHSSEERLRFEVSKYLIGLVQGDSVPMDDLNSVNGFLDKGLQTLLEAVPGREGSNA